MGNCVEKHWGNFSISDYKMEEKASGQLDIQDNKHIFGIIKYKGSVQDKYLMRECL